ncbi:hypothetical protein MRX96_041643 [Rhipicephalus microplus]
MKLYFGAVEVRSLQINIKFDFTRRQGRPLIVRFRAEGQRYVELQEATTTPSPLEMIADITGATLDGLVAQGIVSVNMTLEDLASHSVTAPPGRTL